MVDLYDLDAPKIITLYGRGGTGKTTVASTLPKPQLFLDIKDKGTESAKGIGVKKGDIKVLRVTSLDDIYDVHEYIMDNLDIYSTGSVVLDHLTIAQEISHQETMEENNKNKMSQQLYGFSSGNLKEIIQMYKDLADHGVTVCFIAQTRMEGGDGEGDEQLMPEVGPGLMPSVATFLGSASRIIGHTYLYETIEKTSDLKVKREIEYRLRIGPNPYYITKFTRPKGSPCPMYLVNDLSRNDGKDIWDDIQTIMKGDWSEPKVKNTKKKKRRK